jgi:hypothetical protein
LWLLKNHLSKGAETSVKWKGTAMDPFAVSKGVRQGGVLSTDLYKLYINPLLDQIEDSGIGMQIGTIPCSAPTCADDVSLIADELMKALKNNLAKYDIFVILGYGPFIFIRPSKYGLIMSYRCFVRPSMPRTITSLTCSPFY